MNIQLLKGLQLEGKYSSGPRVGFNLRQGLDYNKVLISKFSILVRLGTNLRHGWMFC